MWTSPTRLHRLPHCLLADAPHSDMCVPAHLFGAHYCQACVNKYPGVERSWVAHTSSPRSSVCRATPPRPPPPLELGWQEPWLHCKHCSYSPSAQTPTLHSILHSGTEAQIQLMHMCTHAREHTRWQTNTYTHLQFPSHYFSLQCSHGEAANVGNAWPFALLKNPRSNMFWWPPRQVITIMLQSIT